MVLMTPRPSPTDFMASASTIEMAKTAGMAINE